MGLRSLGCPPLPPAAAAAGTSGTPPPGLSWTRTCAGDSDAVPPAVTVTTASVRQIFSDPNWISDRVREGVKESRLNLKVLSAAPAAALSRAQWRRMGRAVRVTSPSHESEASPLY